MLDTAIVVRLLDASGHVIAGSEVRWVVKGGGGSVSVGVDTTDRDGLAMTSWLLGVSLDPQLLEAQSLEGHPLDVESHADALTLVSLSTGAGTTCGLTPTGEGWCWGEGLGQGDSVLSNTFPSDWHPHRIAGGHRFRLLAIGEDFGCGIDVAGATWCWGLDHRGQLGTPTGPDPRCDPTLPCTTMPIAIAGGPVFDTLVAGLDGACGLTSADVAWCWGWNYQGMTGVGTGTPLIVTAPTPVATSDRFVQLAGSDHFFCGRRADGIVSCWGANAFAPTPLATTDTFTTLFPGSFGICARTPAGETYCWYATLPPAGLPVRTPALDPFVQTAGDGLGRSYGLDRFGRLYLGFDNRSFREIGNGLRLTTLSSRGETGCGLDGGGHPWCWGSNDRGQLGNPELLDWTDAWVAPHLPVGAPEGSPSSP